ncbi:MAG: 2-oxoacid:acceptor oxidoreductase family protein, partial [Fervidicoccaceae archaeon]
MSNINNEEMIEITWLGRGGQGAVTAAELLAIAAIGEGKAAVAIPEFGAERRGAPVRAYNRLSSSMKELPKTPIVSPNILVVIDPSLVTKAEQYVNFERLRYVVSNTSMS